MTKTAALTLFFLLTTSPLLSASTVVLKSGERVEGTIVSTSREEIYFQSGERIQNYPYRDILEITEFSPEEIRRGFGEEVVQGLESSSASVPALAAAQEVVSREFTQDEFKNKMKAFREFILKHFSKDLKSDEKGVLESLGEALNMPEPATPAVGTPFSIDEVIASYAPYQSDLHEKILNLMKRYLDQWISEVEQGSSSLAEEERFLERVLGRTRLAVLKAALPSMETVRDNIRRRLANLAEMRYAAEQIGVKS